MNFLLKIFAFYKPLVMFFINQGSVSEYMSGSQVLSSGRTRIDMDDRIHRLNIEKTPLMLLLSKVGKDPAIKMKFEWETKERKADWITATAVTGAWSAAAGASGTITVSAANSLLFAEGDVIQIPTISQTVDIYIDSVNTTTGVLTGYTVTSTIDLSTVASSTPNILRIGNAFEVGSGMGTIVTQQPTDAYNYIQIFQTPIGLTTTAQNIAYRTGDEWNEQMYEAGVDHAFKLEKSFFFGQRYQQTTGRMNSLYSQYFTGGIRGFMSTNVTDASGALTQAEFAGWLSDFTKYAQDPVVFAGETVFEGLWQWGNSKLQISSSEDTLGLAYTAYKTPYGKVVKIIPHRELLVEDYAGVAFGVDMADIKYRFLKGKRSLDTHIEVGIQQPDHKRRIDEYRTWAGLMLGNEKRHGYLYGVTSITT